ncbi:flavin reductase family protein [Nocardiopsis deserti]|uniref:flavin reductase family protein n=1 Tax=Nocardiopsis deserti TaxID=2605988 RepID=UPI00168034C4
MHQESVALRFSAPGRPRGFRYWKGIPSRPAPVTGLPVAVEGVAYFDCRLVSCFEAGDHRGVLGRVLACGGLEATASLLHAGREFTTVRGAEAVNRWLGGITGSRPGSPGKREPPSPEDSGVPGSSLGRSGRRWVATYECIGSVVVPARRAWRTPERSPRPRWVSSE